MTTERVQTTLRFVGDWPWWLGAGLALVLGVTAWIFYRRETRPMRWWVNWLLPTLRALAVMMLVLMLAGPVLHHRKIIGELSRLLLFVDGSKSMGLGDPAMDAGRKILILQRLGMLREGVIAMDLPRAGEALAEARALAMKAKDSESGTVDDWKKTVREFSAKIDAARDAVAKAGGDPARLDAFTNEVANPAREIASRDVRQLDDRGRAAQDLARLVEVTARWQTELRERFDRSVSDLAAGENSPLRAAFAKFDAMPRIQRLQAELIEGEKQKVLAKLAERYDVQLLELEGAEGKKIWRPTARDSALPLALPKPEGEITNLATGVKNAAGEEKQGARGAMVIFSDGQHNEGESPVEVAKILAARGIPVFTVGLGSQVRPRDLAVMRVDGPESVFFEDRIHGAVTLKDDMPAGLPFTVSVQDGDKVLWQQQLLTDGSNVRKVVFDFPISDQVKERLKNKQADVEQSSMPLELKVAVSKVEGDRELSNNEGGLRVRAVTQRRKILLLDGRPRWETRYLRNMFERDEQWDVSAVIAGTTAGEVGFVRGDKPGQFPNEAALLLPYDLIIFGEVPRAVFKGDELQWIRDFVANRGGAVVFIDGARRRLNEYADTPIAPLFPVEWKGQPVQENITKLALTDRAAGLAAFALAGEKSQNIDTWTHLPPPHWLSGATALPGAEVLAEAEAGGKKIPAVVARPFGAGRVFYHAFDDSWRWRFEVADLYHVKYWNQIANWIAEIPFAVRDKFVSLDAGGITYRPGESAEIRVRLRDGEGRPVTNAGVDAVLSRDGKKVATIRLAPDENAGGLFRGKTAALEPGNYEVAVQSAAIAERDTKARTEFKVEPRETGELTQLSLNEDLLRQIAATTGGEYLREENIDRLADALAPMSQGKVIESDTVLWQSWWWFVPIVLLLTVEWIVRKRVGML
jgi:hypothetical protein